MKAISAGLRCNPVELIQTAVTVLQTAESCTHFVPPFKLTEAVTRPHPSTVCEITTFPARQVATLSRSPSILHDAQGPSSVGDTAGFDTTLMLTRLHQCKTHPHQSQNG